MSHPVNVQYLEDMRERFDELKSGTERMALLTSMKWNGFDSAVESLIDIWHLEREAWLDEHGVKEADVLINEEGEEVFFDIDEMGTPGDDYQVETVTCKIPSYLNVEYWLAEQL